MRIPDRIGRWLWRSGRGIAAIAVLVVSGLGLEEARPDAEEPTLWHVGSAVPIAVVEGQARFEVPTREPGSKVLVIVAALASRPGPYPIRLACRPSQQVSRPVLADDGPSTAPNLVVPPPPPSPEPASGLPAAERVFHLMVREGDIASAANYVPVRAHLRAVGQGVQIYIDENDLPTVRADLLRDLVTTFDEQILPLAARRFGQACDVDGDRRFTVLLSGWLRRLAGGRLSVDGFVRGADFARDLAAPFGNRCDMMYLSTEVPPGPYLRTLLAHEYTHAVTFCRKALAEPGGALGPEEEGWLDEALAHLAEDLHGFSRANLDYRVSAYLSAPERYRLVVADYYTEGLFRSHGNRGSTYLFLRWCSDRFGPNLMPALIGSRRRGIANLEAATGRTFPDLYRQWATALFLEGLGLEPDSPTGASGWDHPNADKGWLLAGPRAAQIQAGGPDHRWSAAGTSSHYVVVGASTTGAVRIEVDGPAEADLQVTAVLLPATMARLELSIREGSASEGTRSIRAEVCERDGTPVRLTALAWEPLVPAADPRASGYHRGALSGEALAAAFGSLAVPARGHLVSGPITLDGVPRGAGPLIFKLIGLDARGHRIVAWSELDPPPPPPPQKNKNPP
ncbi:MAG: hypothetical protein IRY99_14405, partial [Isosphaeraceae bacterium]|nr:hypothetical protein [Isosphaeraceae bacterium]